MKKLISGVIVFDKIDIMLLSFSVGSFLAFFYKKYNKYKERDEQAILVDELKKKSPIIMLSEDKKPVKIPLLRGGDLIKGLKGSKGFSLVIKNKKLAILVRAIIHAKTKQKQLRLLRVVLFTFNALLSSKVGICFAVESGLDFTQFILISWPSSIIGFMVGIMLENPAISGLLALGLFSGRGVRIIHDPSEKCKVICKFAEELHNKELTLKMKELNSLIQDTSTATQLPLDKVPLLCVEEKYSLLQRYKLKQLIKSRQTKKRVEQFNEFIKRFPECSVDPKVVYEEIVEKIAY